MAKEFIGNYKVIRTIGKGGMAQVFMATQSSLDREVVIKEMNKNLSAEALARFKREATICATLHHNNLVEIYDFFKEGAAHYLVMEYIEGKNLGDIIASEAPMHPMLAAAIAREICRALICAHQNGIIHRDIKPRNVLISKEGVVKLTDFGVARDIEAPELTSTGTIIGTPFYMSPEQASGDKISYQSDIFSLGIVLYEMLTGKKPFMAEENHAIIHKITRGKYKTSFWLDPHHSLRLSRIINKAMKRSPRWRYRSAEDMLADLNRFLGYRGQATIERRLATLLAQAEVATDVTTVVKKKTLKKRKKTASSLYLVLIFLLMLIIILFVTYFINLSK